MTTLKLAYQTGFDLGYAFIQNREITRDSDALHEYIARDEYREENEPIGPWDVSGYAGAVFEYYSHFSPWEMTAAEFNKSRNPDATWEAFYVGLSDGAKAAWEVEQR